jgi:hypothetical protein
VAIAIRFRGFLLAQLLTVAAACLPNLARGQHPVGELDSASLADGGLQNTLATAPRRSVSEPTLSEVMRRLEKLEAEHRVLVDQAVEQLPPSITSSPSPCPSPAIEGSQYDVLYDDGWTLRPREVDRTPFELTIGFHNQFRYTRFNQGAGRFFDAAGNDRLARDRNDFDINRGRLVFSGFAFHPDVGFYVNIDYSTVAADTIQPLLAWITFQVRKEFNFYMGLGKVPGTWEWQQTSRYTLGTDRTMATTFFRPSISAGVWASGSLTDRLHYTAFIGDGFNTLTLQPDDLDTQLVYSGLAWWEPLGDFGVGFSDLEHHPQAAMRIGHGLTHTTNESAPNLGPGAEGTVIRVSDGTRLVTPGIFAPDESVNAFDIWLYTAHLGVKRRGVSFSTEYFLRWLRNLEGTQGSRFGSLFDHGFYAQGSFFAVPDRIEVFARGSQVSGAFGTGDEIACGFNWYLFGQRNARATFELTDVNDSPAQQSRTGYVAGGSGTLFRTQLWTFF